MIARFVIPQHEIKTLSSLRSTLFDKFLKSEKN